MYHSLGFNSPKKAAPFSGATILQEANGGKSGLGKKGAALAEGAAQVGSRNTKEEGRNHWLRPLCLPLKLHLPGQSRGAGEGAQS